MSYPPTVTFTTIDQTEDTILTFLQVQTNINFILNTSYSPAIPYASGLISWIIIKTSS